MHSSYGDAFVAHFVCPPRAWQGCDWWTFVLIWHAEHSGRGLFLLREGIYLVCDSSWHSTLRQGAVVWTTISLKRLDLRRCLLGSGRLRVHVYISYFERLNDHMSLADAKYPLLSTIESNHWSLLNVPSQFSPTSSKVECGRSVGHSKAHDVPSRGQA